MMKRFANTLRCQCPCGFTVEGTAKEAAAMFSDHRDECLEAAKTRRPSRPSTLKSTDKIRRSWPVIWPDDAA